MTMKKSESLYHLQTREPCKLLTSYESLEISDFKAICIALTSMNLTPLIETKFTKQSVIPHNTESPITPGHFRPDEKPTRPA